MAEEKSFEQIMKELDEGIEMGKQYLLSKGKTIDLDEWVTVSQYVKLFGLKSESVVLNWISRGLVPEDHVIRVPKLNEIRLIKAVPYKETAGVK